MSDSYLLQCKQNYFDNITPSNNSSREKEGYKRIVAIAKGYFNRGDYKEFAGFFKEGQYFISLWAAHMIIEYGSPSNDLRIESIDVIKRYTDNPLAPEVAKEERDWIRNNIHTMETHEQIIERLKSNSQKLEDLVDKVKLLAGNIKSDELDKLKKEIDEEQNRILDALWKLKEEANKKLQ